MPEEIGEGPALQRRGRPVPELSLGFEECLGELVLTLGREMVRRHPPHVDELEAHDRRARRQRAAPVEHHALHGHRPATYVLRSVPMSAPTRSVPIPASLLLVAQRVERRLDDVFAAEIERWRSLDETLVEPLASLRDFVMKGG